ncbi:MAG TPA: hypothetical protein O0X58_04540 [Methanocorpusculum sp.]|nr:hypothetical protein [Methanocorpusculum sp.]
MNKAPITPVTEPITRHTRTTAKRNLYYFRYERMRRIVRPAFLGFAPLWCPILGGIYASSVFV